MKNLPYLFAFLLIVSCTDYNIEESLDELAPNETSSEEATTTFKIKGGNGKPKECTEYRFNYYTDDTAPGMIFSANMSTTETCIDIFQGIERILGIQLGTTWECLTDGQNLTNRHGSIRCDGSIELYYKPGKLKYRVILSGGSWTGNCPPQDGETSCLSFSLMEIIADGRHDKNCLTGNDPISIGLHKIYITNDGEVI